MHRSLNRLRCLLILSLCLAAPAFGQEPSLADRLPSDTWFYLHWHGTGSLFTAQQKNHVLQLWADPGFAPVRRAITDQITNGGSSKPKPGSMTAEQRTAIMNIVIGMLENPIIIGTSGPLHLDQKNSASSPSDMPQPNAANPQPGYFLIIDLSADQTGKAMAFAKLAMTFNSQGKLTTPSATYTVEGATINEIQEEHQKTYAATVGHYYVRTGQLDLMKQLVPRLLAPANPARSLSENPAYQQARQQFGAGNLAEVFFRIPDLKDLQLPASAKIDAAAFTRALHTDSLKVACGSLNLSGEAAHMRFAMLGDTTHGGLFDFVGPSKDSFATMALAPAGATFQASRIDFAALYLTISRALIAALPKEQSDNITRMDSFGALALGMPIADALHLFTGEFASIRTSLDGDVSSGLFGATIKDPDKVVSLLSHVLGSSVSTEDRVGDTTFLEISTPYTDPKTLVVRRRFYAVAVAPNFLVVGPRKAPVREALARATNSSGSKPAANFATDPQFIRVRALLPQNLSGLGYADLAHMDWTKVIASFSSQQDYKIQGGAANSKPPAASNPIEGLDPAIFPRYLHVTYSGMWKDSGGVYFDSYIQ